MPRLSSVSSRSLTGQGVGKTVSVSSITPAASSINEGSGLTFNVVTANAISGSTLYWTVNHTSTASADFSATSGSFTITNNAGSFTVTPTADLTTEGAEAFTVSVRLGSISGTVLGTSSSVTVNDTSTTPVAVSITSYYGASGQSTTVSSSRLTVSSVRSKFGTKSLLATNTAGFGGRANAVNVPLSASLTAPFTIEAWFYLTAAYAGPSWPQAFPIYLMKDNIDLATTNPTDSLRLEVYGGTASFGASTQLCTTASYPYTIASGGGGNNISLNTWHHVVLCQSSITSQTFWINGTRFGPYTTGTFDSTLNYLVLNSFGAGQEAYYDDVRITAGDRYGVSNATITVPAAQLTSDANTRALVTFE